MGPFSKPDKHRWLSEHWHAIGWLVSAVVVFAAYLSIHHWLHNRYLDSIDPEITNSVKMYGLQVHPRTGILELQVAGKPYVSTDREAGPMGIGKLPAARGLLTSAATTLDKYNRDLADYVGSLLKSFSVLHTNPRYMKTPLSVIAPEFHRNLVESCDCGTSKTVMYELHVPVESVIDVQRLYPNERAAAKLIDIIDGGIIKRLRSGERDSKTISSSHSAGQKERKVSDEVYGRIKTLQQGVCRIFVHQNQNAAPSEGGPFQCEIAPSSNDDGKEGKTCPSSETQSIDLRPGESKFHRDLKCVVRDSAGFFWTSGRYLWWEIMMLAFLGVLTSRLVQTGRHYARGAGENGFREMNLDVHTGRHYAGGTDRTLVWQPRDSVRTLMYLATAPIFALVIIWILSLTNLLSIEPMLGDVWSNAAVPVAFLIGLFPSVGYDVLQGLASGLFNRSSRQEEGTIEARRWRIPILREGAAPDEGTPPSFDVFRARVRHYATAVFRAERK